MGALLLSTGVCKCLMRPVRTAEYPPAQRLSIGWPCATPGTQPSSATSPLACRGDFIVDQYVTEGRSLFMSRCGRRLTCGSVGAGEFCRNCSAAVVPSAQE